MELVIKSKKKERAEAAIRAIRKQVHHGKRIRVGGEEYTADKLCEVYENEIDAIAAVERTWHAYEAAVAREHSLSTRLGTFDREVRLVLNLDEDEEPTRASPAKKSKRPTAKRRKSRR